MTRTFVNAALTQVAYYRHSPVVRRTASAKKKNSVEEFILLAFFSTRLSSLCYPTNRKLRSNSRGLLPFSFSLLRKSEVSFVLLVLLEEGRI